MWSLEWPERGSAAHLDVCSLSLTGGLFDSDDTKHKPPDLLELDPDLLRTLNLPSQTSVDNQDSEANLAMIDNWEMNEVFQDISSILNESTDQTSANYDDQTTDIDEIVKDVLDAEVDIENFCAPADTEAIDPVTHAAVDLSWIIKETIGTTALSPQQSLDDHVHLDYDLLNQLEAMEDNGISVPIALEPLSPQMDAPSTPNANVIESPRSSVSSIEECASVVASDHQYTQLASIVVKPHETSKQAVRRVKNNAASRVCRRQRKTRLTTNIDKVADLIAKNRELLQKIADAESIVTLLKNHLVNATCKK